MDREHETRDAGFPHMGDVDAEPRPRRSAETRVCVEPDCRTVLSRYNDGAHCALHAPMQVPRTRGRKV